MIRSIQTTPDKLDETLVSLQKEGNRINQIFPCPTSFDGKGEDLGRGQSDFSTKVEMGIVVIYQQCLRGPITSVSGTAESASA